MAYSTFNFDYEQAYTSFVKFNTLVDDTESGGEQRRDIWTNPRRKWRLEFNVLTAQREAIINFFIARKGRKEAFNWIWRATDPTTGEEYGGDGVTYLVRFDMDELSFDHVVIGFNTFYIDLIQVFS